MQAANDNTPEIPVDLADYLAHALYGRNARACDLIGGSNAKILEDALAAIYRLRRLAGGAQRWMLSSWGGAPALTAATRACARSGA